MQGDEVVEIQDGFVFRSALGRERIYRSGQIRKAEGIPDISSQNSAQSLEGLKIDIDYNNPPETAVWAFDNHEHVYKFLGKMGVKNPSELAGKPLGIWRMGERTVGVIY